MNIDSPGSLGAILRVPGVKNVQNMFFLICPSLSSPLGGLIIGIIIEPRGPWYGGGMIVGIIMGSITWIIEGITWDYMARLLTITLVKTFNSWEDRTPFEDLNPIGDLNPVEH